MSDTLGIGLVARAISGTGSSEERTSEALSAATSTPDKEKIHIRQRSPNRRVCFITPSKQFTTIEVTDFAKIHSNNVNDSMPADDSKA